MISDSPDEYFTIKRPAKDKIKVEGSIFIATAIPVDSEEEAESRIKKIAKEFFDATHNCFAWRIICSGRESVKSSDAGEPRGTARKPILAAIQSENLYNVLVVVTRYFGGIKLGRGGLSRAYRASAQSALKKAEKVAGWITCQMALSYPLSMTGKVNTILGKYGARVLESSFKVRAGLRIEVRISLTETIKKALTDATNGQVTFE
ncbi:MAG: YigZ family protein [Candidatus Zixiibacteriota bacterium]